MVLETARLLLRSPQEIEGAQTCAYYRKNRDFLRPFSPKTEDTFYTEACQSALLQEQTQDWEAGRACRFFLCSKAAPDCVIGTVALSNIVRAAFCSCFLGYSMDAAQTRRGYMTEAVEQMVAFAFEKLQLHRIEGNVMPRNRASRAVLEKCGFIQEGISKQYLQINGVWEDHIHYVRLNAKL